MILVERDQALGLLADLLDGASDGRGRVALIRGEAGIGKTTVVKEFVAGIDDAHIMWGGCDDLMAARPLGPLWDMAFDEPALLESLESSQRQSTFTTVLELLSRSLRPTVMIIEDIHWADDATVDLVKFVGRRIDRTHGLLVLTYRDGEVVGDHPLRVALGDLPYGLVERIPLDPLSEEGVALLAGVDIDPRSLWELTGGNPFFVSEVVATAGENVPSSIRDAVNARVRRLSAQARALVELTCVSPSKIELVIIEDALGDVSDAIAECEEAGILELSGDSLRFRHELARRAVERELPLITRRSLNLACLGACERLGFDLSRCAHHAREAEDAESIVRILPDAARRASEMESHAEALATLRALEPYIDRLTPEQQAAHYDLWAFEEYLSADRGMEMIEKAIEIRRELGEPGALGNSLLIASRVAWVGTNRSLAVRYAEEAADVVEAIGGEDLAMAYSVLSQLAMLGGFADATVAWAEKALALVGETDSPVKGHALNNIGAVKMTGDLSAGLDELLESRRISAAVNNVHDETRACVNLAWNYLTHYELDDAIAWIEEAMTVAGDAEMPSFESYTYAEKAWWHEMRGEWDQAEAVATSLIERGTSLKTAQTVSSILLAKIASRRGSPAARDLIDDAIRMAEFSEEAQRLGPAYAVLAEYGWLGGELTQEELDRAVEVMHWCAEHLNQWSAGEIAQWLALMHVLDEVPRDTPESFRLLVAGDWAEAAAWWEDHGVPYERAVAQSHGDPKAQLAALDTLDELGAGPLGARIRNSLHEAGVTGVPRGPQKATRDSPLGLTARQTDVLALLVEDLTNAEIADRLFISTRTVDHHVSAILTKLGANSRSEAAEKARQVLSLV
jgi:DNA-binding CsgD family transcriptional regulator/tetratricopeptide (TPR) repeat protein